MQREERRHVTMIDRRKLPKAIGTISTKYLLLYSI